MRTARWTKVSENGYRYKNSAYVAVKENLDGRECWSVFSRGERVPGVDSEDTRRYAGSAIEAIIREKVMRELVEGLSYFDGQTLDTIEYALCTLRFPDDEYGDDEWRERLRMRQASERILEAIEQAR